MKKRGRDESAGGESMKRKMAEKGRADQTVLQTERRIMEKRP